MFSVYILHSVSIDKYYIGHTNDLTGRVRRHNSAGNKFTSKGQPWRIVFSENYPTKELAHFREREIKNWKSRKMIEKLIDVG